MPTDRSALRAAALDAAVALHARPFDDCPFPGDDLLATATALYAWLTAPVALAPLTYGPVTDQATGTATTTPGASPMANLQLGDTQEVTATAVALDADAQPTTDTLTWTTSAATAVTLQPAADTMSCVILGATPTPDVVITATDSLGNTTTGEIDVVAGPATALSLQFGPVTAQAPATAPASAAAGGTAPAATSAPPAGA